MEPSETSDILVQIPDDDLCKLAALYEKTASWAPYFVPFVHMGIRWKQSEKFRDKINFMSPKNSWEQDGTIIVTLTLLDSLDVYVFTLDDHCVNLYEGLCQTNLIDYNKRVLFYCVHEKHSPAVFRALKSKNIDISWSHESVIFIISPEEAKNFETECPTDFVVKRLEPSAAKQINSSWPHKYPGSEKYIASFIEKNGGYGLFTKTNELVSWVLEHCLGLGMLQTDQNYRRRGFGNLMVKVVSKKIAQNGFWPMAATMKTNQASIRNFEKLGFRNIATCLFIAKEITPLTLSESTIMYLSE